ncbi:NAD-dependent epimerase/dehydratase family protein [Paramicrobacterium chengjingii]|uniref:NAD(P)-dependent oxidoreductase n=1 Tax=Paramicrobacterium chengjingii TaxID=2769067 RepID=A0ABX6YJB4_9MICO|nr:NAD(P)-dependent oxidoreductase [Microbacterium chengjingii]QPZ38894.1 NAD(P)-dependent oxidoreductase [Microbacterium chengjingii]
MILITGGTGFIGSHTVRALHELGETCLLFQRSATSIPDHLADVPVLVEQGDVTDRDAVLDVGRRHRITGIVHLAGYAEWLSGPDAAAPAARRALSPLFNIIDAAQTWGVDRVSVASTIGVYGGVDAEGPLREDMPVLLSAPHPIPRSKKISELLTEQLAEASGIEIINLRISGTWGPRGHDDPFFAAPALVHAAARGRAPDFSAQIAQPYADDALDLCYVKDTGRAIAMLQRADTLSHRTYNIGSGRSTSNADIMTALSDVGAPVEYELPTGATSSMPPMDIERLAKDTGFAPEYDTERAVADYLAWLKAGNVR